MKITLGYDFEKKEIITEKRENEINLNEKMILESIIENLENEFNKSNFSIVASTTNYLTLKYKEYDIARIKYTNKSKWISVFIVNKDLRSQYENNKLFETQKNKKQLHWKSILSNEDISDYLKILRVACEDINKKKRN